LPLLAAEATVVVLTGARVFVAPALVVEDAAGVLPAAEAVLEFALVLAPDVPLWPALSSPIRVCSRLANSAAKPSVPLLLPAPGLVSAVFREIAPRSCAAPQPPRVPESAVPALKADCDCGFQPELLSASKLSMGHSSPPATASRGDSRTPGTRFAGYAR
jgi:hypothetical protein